MSLNRRTLEFMNVFTDGARKYGKYPVSVHGKRVHSIFSFSFLSQR